MGKIERPSLEGLIMDFAISLTRRSTCKRAQFSCVVASEDMTQIYGFGYNGTARGLSHDDCKEDQPGNCGCFVQGSLVTTDRGPVEIQRIGIGDRVLTHENRFERVTDTFKHAYDGLLMEIFLESASPLNYARRKTATEEHPFFIRRGTTTGWLEAKDIVPGDYVAVKGKDCPGCGEPVPHYRRLCQRCFRESAQTLRTRRQSSQRMRLHNPMRGIHRYDPLRAAIRQVHMQKDTTRKVFLELKQEYETKGWRCLIVDHCVRPDIIAIKDSAVIGIEYDRKLWPHKEKYSDRPEVRSQYDDIVWHGKHDATYSRMNEAFVWSKVTMMRAKAVDQPVFNLEVAEDNSFVAQSAVVHNCVHAEINALIKVRVNDPKKVVFVTGQPCVTCAKAIINSGASKVYYRSAYRSTEGLDLIKRIGIEVERV